MRKGFLRRMILTTACLGMLAGFSVTAAAAGRFEGTTSRDENNNICIDFEDIQVILPSDWSGKCQMGTSADTVSFYQTKSRRLWTEELGYANGGWLFSISFTQTSDYLDNPSYRTIGSVEDGIYYATFPTDFQAYENDEEACREYVSMSCDTDWIMENITLTAGNSFALADDEYIFPESDSAYLAREDLAGMSADEVQMAINEIYARHHRLFVLKDVQEYFDSKSWYDGYISADNFDTGVMNVYECAKINTKTAF